MTPHARALGALCLLGACAAPKPQVELAGAVAVVGNERLDATTLAQWHATHPAQSPRELTEAWVRTTLLAQAASERGLVHEGRSPALVRRMISAWTRAAATPPTATSEDIAAARRDDWRRFDRPAAVVVHHAVFMKKGGGALPDVAVALQLGRTLAARVKPDWDFARFSAAARELPLPPGLEVRAEQLPAFVADGRAVEQPSSFDAEFARQAFLLRAAGDSSAAFETRFGVHVVQLESVQPALHASDAEIAEAIAPELIGRRVRVVQGAALERAQPIHPVQLAPSAEEDMATYTTRLLQPPE